MERVRQLAALIVVGGVLLAGMLFPVIGGTGILARQVAESATATSGSIRGGVLPSASVVTDSSGAPVAYFYDQYRQSVPGDRIAPAMKAAIVAIEDRRFYDHGGVDPVGTARALVNNSQGGETQGASTLTEQYVKNYDLYVVARTDAEREAAVAPNYARKIKEAELAISLDHQLTKDQILTGYLNLVYFGHGAYGVQAAARAYFGVDASALTIPQAAMLAGMVQSPTEFDPIRHPDAANARRNTTIDQMRDAGSITPAQSAQAGAAPLGARPDPEVPAEGCTGAGDAGFFCDYVLSYLGKAGMSRQQLIDGGYTVRTTLDRAQLGSLKAAVDGQVPPDQPHVANVMSIVRPGRQSHQVTAMAANRTFGNADGQSSYGLPFEPENMGAGSVYKIFTAATAMQRGDIGIDSVIPVPPSGYASPIYRDGNGTPIPVRNDGTYAGALPLTDALAQSPNTAFVKLEETTGVGPVVDMAVNLGLTSLAEPPSTGDDTTSIATTTKEQNLASFTLGTTPTSDLELANVQATLASHGTWCPPTPLAGAGAVTGPDGAPVPVPEQGCRQAVAPGLADTLLDGMSRDAQPGGTSHDAAAGEGWTRPVAAKTGTTQEYKSATFVGATPDLAGAAIVFDDSSSPRPICAGSPPYTCGSGNIYGGTAPARTWYRAMGDILGAAPVTPLPPPDPRYRTGRH